MEVGSGTFKLTKQTRITADAPARAAGELLATKLRPATGFSFQLDAAGAGASGAIQLTTNGAKAELGAEGYELSVTPERVVIRAPQPAGLFYGAQTLLQLLPPDIFAAKAAAMTDWEIPAMQIEDWPRFQWRGLMLDVSRHFFTKAEVKRLLDEMALHKLNTFHWHLTDDHGWRIEIKKYPKLTAVGAWRKEIGFKLDPKASTAYGADGRYGGFYTQDDIREVVAYAQARGITIVPEIEMPGHASAALLAYPEYSCTGGPFSTDLPGGVFHGVYCAGDDKTFAFLQDVLTEVIQLFPGKYIHIGGDEVLKENWTNCVKCLKRMDQEGLKTGHELQSYFTRRAEKIISAQGRALIGWSEISEGGLAQNAAVMDWIGGAVEAASAGHNVVMSPQSHCYFDHYQSTNHAAEPYAIGGFLPLRKVYDFEPMPAKLEARHQRHILGAQGNVWTEYMPNFRHVEYMIFPRACALAEAGWSAKATRNWDDFTRRLQIHGRRLDELGVNYRRP
jgi:hexosaminidase